ncbi:uncharacterized protein PG986_012515 [Apiospora aurea]|uniref:Uncharacterized protein n=1 Tax=Apiospora aurea TaxID=335848 RepID=A0ABR1Q0U8_9PEZI
MRLLPSVRFSVLVALLRRRLRPFGEGVKYLLISCEKRASRFFACAWTSQLRDIHPRLAFGPTKDCFPAIHGYEHASWAQYMTQIRNPFCAQTMLPARNSRLPMRARASRGCVGSIAIRFNSLMARAPTELQARPVVSRNYGLGRTYYTEDGIRRSAETERWGVRRKPEVEMTQKPLAQGSYYYQYTCTTSNPTENAGSMKEKKPGGGPTRRAVWAARM